MVNTVLWIVVVLVIVGSFAGVIINLFARFSGYYRTRGGHKEYLKRLYLGIAGVGFGVFLAWLFIGLGWMQNS